MRSSVLMVTLVACSGQPPSVERCPPGEFVGDLTADGLSVNRDQVSVVGAQVGDCGEQAVGLCYPHFLESNPVRAPLMRRPIAGCSVSAGRTATLKFDLTPMKVDWREGYRRESGTIILTLQAAGADYSF